MDLRQAMVIFGKALARNMKRIFPLFILFLSLLVFTPLMYAQSPTSRDALIQKIEKRAQRDVELGKARQSTTELNILFGDKAKTAGLPMDEASDIYEEAFQKADSAAKSSQPWVGTIHTLKCQGDWPRHYFLDRRLPEYHY